MRLVDTTGLKRRKEGYEAELAEIEADIKKLNKLYVFVDWLYAYDSLINHNTAFKYLTHNLLIT